MSVRPTPAFQLHNPAIALHWHHLARVPPMPLYAPPYKAETSDLKPLVLLPKYMIQHDPVQSAIRDPSPQPLHLTSHDCIGIIVTAPIRHHSAEYEVYESTIDSLANQLASLQCLAPLDATDIFHSHLSLLAFFVFLSFYPFTILSSYLPILLSSLLPTFPKFAR